MSNTLLPLSPRIFLLFNFISFQSAWFIAVKMQHQGVLLLLVLLIAHFVVSQGRIRDWYTVFFIAFIGSMVDLSCAYLGLFAFKSGNLIPMWLLLLWANFALTLHYSMAWLANVSRFLQALLGGVFGCLSYFSAHKLGAVDYPFGTPLTIFALLVIWAATLPVYVYIACRLREKYHGNKNQFLSNNGTFYQ